MLCWKEGSLTSHHESLDWCLLFSLSPAITHSLPTRPLFSFLQHQVSTKSSVKYCLTFHLLLIWLIDFLFVPQSLKHGFFPHWDPENDLAGVTNNYLPTKSRKHFSVLVVFDLLEPVTLLAMPSFSASHSLFLWTSSLPVDLICLWLLLYRIPFLCPQMLMFPRISVLCSLFTLSSPCTDYIHISGFTLNVVDFQVFIPSHVTPPEFRLPPSHTHLNILQTPQTMHLWNWSHYLIHPELSLLPYPLPWKYHHSLQCIHEVSAFFIPHLKSITLLVKNLISMNRNQVKLAD